MIQTTFNFVLPRGYLDSTGQLQRAGTMRLATALDEIEAGRHPRVIDNEAYLPVALLARVITHLGALPAITPQVVEGMFASDLAYLEDLYLRLNSAESVVLGATCPLCSGQIEIEVAPLV
jgi:hypothetical protein